MGAISELELHDEMIDRAAKAIGRVTEAPNEGGLSDAEIDHLAAEAALRAAFEDVPLTNYGIGLALQFFDLVICIKDRELSPVAGVYRKNGEPHSFDAVPHYLEVGWQHKPTRYIKRVAVSKLGAPGEVAA